MKLIVATHNAGKLKEFKEILSPIGFDVHGLKDLSIKISWNETGSTFQQNAHIKIDAIQQQVPGCWILADDSGLCVDALNGEPGIHSSHYCGREGDSVGNMNHLITNLQKKNLNDASAYFQCLLVLQNEKGLRQEFVGQLKGKVILTPRGKNGFGYDPIFIPNQFNETLAELADSVKNQISHRAKAVEKMLESLKNFRGS